MAAREGEAPARRTVVGTAGHIDHGKTSLVRALTGIDCDRWQEEKDRGITIDLGFAWLRQGDLQVGFVDVPGHEKFLHNALAGLGGIGLVLLVVAADEGVKPQTREHLDVCRLLGIPRAVVALTKADLVSDDLLELAELEVVELLADTAWAEAPRFAVSSTTGQGVDELRTALLEAAGEAAAAAGTSADTPPRDELPARLPLDRAFHLKGLGVVVTGTLASGRIAVGDSLEKMPAGGTVRVRGIQVHGEGREEARAGERTSLQLGGASLEELQRGVELVTADRFAPCRRFLGRFTLLEDAPKELTGFEPVRVHVHTAEVMGRLRPVASEGEGDGGGDGTAGLAPGESGLVEVRLAAPVVAVRGDRFIVRRPSPAATLGGGEVLDPGFLPPRGGDRPSVTALERAFEGGDDAALLAWVGRAGEAGVTGGEMARRLGRHPAPVGERLAALAAEGKLLRLGGDDGPASSFIVAAAFRRVVGRAERVLGDYFASHRLAGGMPKAEAVERILPGGAGDHSAVYLQWLEAQGVLTVDAGQVNLPGREAELTGRESDLARALVAAYDEAGLAPPSPAEMARRLDAKPQIVDGLVGYLVEQGRLARLPDGLLVATSSVDRLRAELAATGWERFTVAQFKERFGLSRKWAIPLLEHLDSTGATRRLGDERQVLVQP